MRRNSPTHKITGCLSKSIWFTYSGRYQWFSMPPAHRNHPGEFLWKICLGPTPRHLVLRTTALAHPRRPPILSCCTNAFLYLTSNLYKLKSSVVGLRRAKKITKPRPIQKRQFPKRPKSRAWWLRMPLRGLSHLMNPTVATRGHLQELLQRLLLKSKGGLRVIPYSQSFALYKHPDRSNIQESRPFGLFITDW